MDHRDGGKVALERLRAAGARRAVGRTGLNADSSRSHLIVGFRVETSKETAPAPGLEPGTSRSSAKLFLVDLAGCEKAAKSLAAGDRLDEAKGINKSLSALGNVVSALVERDRVGAFGGILRSGVRLPTEPTKPTRPREQPPKAESQSKRPHRRTFLTGTRSSRSSCRNRWVETPGRRSLCASPRTTRTPRRRCRRCDSALARGGSRRGSNAGIVRSRVRFPAGALREIAALRAQVAILTRDLAAAAARGRIEATGSVDAGDLATKFSKFSKNDALSGRVRARGGGVLDALTATLGDGSARFAIRGDVGGRNEGWAAPIVAGVALSLLFQAIDKIAAAA